MKNKQFWDTAQVFYNRTHNLREYYQNEANPIHKRRKASYLWFIMFTRMQKVNEIAIKISLPQPPKFNSGCVHFKNEDQSPILDNSEKIIKVN